MKKLSFLILLVVTFTTAIAQQDVEVIYIEDDIEMEEVVEMPPGEEVPQIFTIVEEMPEFPGGNEGLSKFLSSNIKYPEIARSNGVEDKVLVKFVVNEDGKITNASVVRGEYTFLNKEALRVVSLLPDFIPGMQRGKPVKVWFVLPITFKLTSPEEKKNK